MNDPLNRTWDWRILTRECPVCGASIADDATRDHASWHWLTNTEPRERVELGGVSPYTAAIDIIPTRKDQP